MKKMSRRFGVTAAAAAAVSVGMVALSAPAFAYTDFGAYSEINCNHTVAGEDKTCGEIPSHSSQHWIQAQVQCLSAGSMGTEHMNVIDVNTGATVYTASCTGTNSSMHMINGLYGVYKVEIWGGATGGNAMIRNCTSECGIHNL